MLNSTLWCYVCGWTFYLFPHPPPGPPPSSPLTPVSPVSPVVHPPSTAVPCLSIPPPPPPPVPQQYTHCTLTPSLPLLHCHYSTATPFLPLVLPPPSPLHHHHLTPPYPALLPPYRSPLPPAVHPIHHLSFPSNRARPLEAWIALRADYGRLHCTALRGAASAPALRELATNRRCTTHNAQRTYMVLDLVLAVLTLLSLSLSRQVLQITHTRQFIQSIWSCQSVKSVSLSLLCVSLSRFLSCLALPCLVLSCLVLSCLSVCLSLPTSMSTTLLLLLLYNLYSIHHTPHTIQK